MKRQISFALAALMALSLAACGGSKENSSKGSTAAQGSEGQKADASGKKWKIGSQGPLTGGAAVYGNAVVHGAEIAIDEINANGGINGYQIEYKKADDEHDQEKAVNAYNSLKDWGMQFLVGPTTSAPAIAVGTESEADNLFMISVYSTGIHDSFKEAAPKQGLDIVADEQFTADSNKDFSTQLQKMKDSGADLVFLPFYYTEAALVLTQANTMGYKPTFFGCDGMDGILNVENFDTKLADGLMLLTPFAADSKDELTVNFVKKYKEKFNDTPIQFAADAYDAVYAVKAAAEKANVTPDMSVSDLGDAMEKAMTEISLNGLTGSNMKWDASGDVDKEPKAVVIKDGAYVSAE